MDTTPAGVGRTRNGILRPARWTTADLVDYFERRVSNNDWLTNNRPRLRVMPRRDIVSKHIDSAKRDPVEWKGLIDMLVQKMPEVVIDSGERSVWAIFQRNVAWLLDSLRWHDDEGFYFAGCGEWVQVWQNNAGLYEDPPTDELWPAERDADNDAWYHTVRVRDADQFAQAISLWSPRQTRKHAVFMFESVAGGVVPEAEAKLLTSALAAPHGLTTAELLGCVDYLLAARCDADDAPKLATGYRSWIDPATTRASGDQDWRRLGRARYAGDPRLVPAKIPPGHPRSQ